MITITRFLRILPCLGIVLWTVLSFPSFLTAQTPSLLSPTELNRFGLKRVWFYTLKHHSAKGKIENIFLEGGQLFITTSDAMLHVLDSETGQWLWSRAIGKKGISLTEPAVNSRIVAVHNNLTVFLFNRQTGKQLLQIPLPEAASAACELSEHYLYVPMVNQTLLVYVLREALTPHSPETHTDSVRNIDTENDPELKKIVQHFDDAKRLFRTILPEKPEDEGFILDSTHRIPITGVAYGTVRSKPLIVSQYYSWVLDDAEQPTHEVDKNTHRELVSWVTEQGFLHTAKIEQLSESLMSDQYRINSAGQTFFMDRSQTIQIDRPGSKELTARPTQSQLYPVNELRPDKIIVPAIVVTGGRAAYVFAINTKTGEVHWQYPTQGQLLESIAVIGGDVYAPTANGVLHSIDLITGKERWFTKNVKKFIAASQKHVYVLDRRNRLVCLDRASGESLFVYNVRRFDHVFFNVETDQIFLLTDNGLVQCLRERQFASDAGSDASLRHRISSVEFAKVLKGGEMPELWWLHGFE